MHLKIGDRIACCPYCGSNDFAQDEREGAPTPEVMCSRCGGFASRRIVLQAFLSPSRDRDGPPP